MFEINDAAVDVNTREPVLITNLIAPDASEPDAYLPYDGLVFTMNGRTVVTWGIQNVRSRVFRKATDEERANLMPQFEARCAEMTGRAER